MWTVHEDEYKSAEASFAGLPQAGWGGEDDRTSKPIGVYTKSSQVFVTSSVTPSDSTPMNNSYTYNSNVLRSRNPTPAGSPLPNGFFSRPQAATSCQPSIMRVDAPPFEPSPNNMAAPISYAVTPTVNKRGRTSVQVSHINVPESRNLRAVMSMDDIFAGEKERNVPHCMEWNNHTANPYHSHVAVRGYNGPITADSLQGSVYETAKDQHGCRFLQRLLAGSNSDGEIARTIMNEIVPHVAELMTDQYANFLIQKLFDIMPHDVRYKVACFAAPKIASIALTPHGTFSVQKMVETIATREEMEILRGALSKDVVRLVKDAHGNHVIQKVLQRFSFADKEFIYTAVGSDCASIAKNKQGCCVLQRCLEHASELQKTTLVNHILSCCLEIADDPFGNYVLQYVLEFNDTTAKDTIALAFLPHLVQLCMNKFSSNVMEKVLRGASQLVQEMYVETMCSPDVVAQLIQDDFGNYVLQTALSICSSTQAEALVSAVRPLMSTIRNAPYAKKLEGRLEGVAHRTSNGRHSGNEYDNTRQLDMHAMKGDGVPLQQQQQQLQLERGRTRDPAETPHQPPSG